MKRRTLIALGIASLLHLGPLGTAHAQNTELVVGSTVSGPPFSFRDGNSYSGFDIDLWDQVAKAIGRRYRIQPMEFAGLIPALQTRNMDVVTAQLFIRPERQQIIDFSEPYYESGLIAAVKIDNTGINTSADLAGKVIGTETGTVAVNFVKTNIQNAKLEQLSDINAVLLALEAGRVEAVIYDAPKLALYAEKAGKGKVKLIYPKIYTVNVGLGFQKGSDLVGPVNKALAEMKADGRLAALTKKWFGQ